jgi:nitroimidazol reductase NimA-like FMN-containing flavoprotein (pyridoxamine 5'-phosphate oxidase superfamily)
MPSTEVNVLGTRECLTLLRSVGVGRLVFSANALPAIRPVNFAVVNGQIVVRGARDPWAAKLDNAVVAFEVDEIDEQTNTGWNVVVIGKAHIVTDFDEIVQLSDPTTRPWVNGHGDRFLTVDMEQITGRRLTLTRACD